MTDLIGLVIIFEILCNAILTSNGGHINQYTTPRQKFQNERVPDSSPAGQRGNHYHLSDREEDFNNMPRFYHRHDNNYSVYHSDEVEKRSRYGDGVRLEPKISAVQQREIRGQISSNAFANRHMVYPSQYDENSGRKRDIEMPIAKGNCSYGFCEEVENYPTEKVLALLKKNPALKQYFSDFFPIPDIGNRGTFGDGETLCDTKTHTKFPKTARNLENVEMTIVNVEGHQQGIVFETCGTDDGACKFSEAFPNGYVSVCKQKYVQRRMMVVGSKSENLLFDTFEFPSCCICTIRKM